MGLPSGTYSSATSGPLQISFSGEFEIPGGSYWNPSGTAEIYLGCTVTDGTTTKKVNISALAPVAVMDWDYVTGTTLTCSMATDYSRVSGVSPAYARKLRIRAILIKR